MKKILILRLSRRYFYWRTTNRNWRNKVTIDIEATKYADIDIDIVAMKYANIGIEAQKKILIESTKEAPVSV